MGRHYLLIESNIGTVKNPITQREYIELAEPEESKESALARYIASHPDMIDRQRYRPQTEARIRGAIERLQICHPSSWWREKAEAAGLPYPVPVGKGGAKRAR